MSNVDAEEYQHTMMLDSEYAPGGVIVYYADGDEEIIHVNQYVIDLFECDSTDEFMQLTGGTFRGFVYGEDIDSTEDSIWGQVEKHDNLDHIFYRIKTKSGNLVNIQDFGRLVRTSNGRPVFHVFIIEMKAIGYVDWLTGLPAMRRFHHLAHMRAESMRGRGEQPVAIALDLIGLKAYNAQYGRDEGDQLLCTFADLLRKHFGSEACSRFGEDHFYAFTHNEGVEERLSSLFDDFRTVNDGRTLPVRVGAYLCRDGDDIVAIGFDRAKLACDLDKKTWHSHVMWFNEDMRAEEQLRIYVLEHIDEAIEKGWVQPHYQAIMRAATGAICGEEALARWIDPVHGPLMPNQFIPVLEESELLQKIDLHMISNVIADMKTKQEAGIVLVPVSINISLRDLGQIDIANEVALRADEAGIPHNLLRIEFTESAASADIDFFKAQVERIHAAGFEVWLDDFGSGYSSLNMLQEYDFDLIKLDMEFARHVDNHKAREILTGVVRSAGRLGVGTLAEGVETEEQVRFLEGIGCSLLQGFYFSRPIPLSEVVAIATSPQANTRERREEFEYWNEVDAVDLVDPTSHVEGRAVDGTQLSEFPAGVMEVRGDTWRLLRSNRAYREFLDNGGAIPLEESSSGAVVFKRGVDAEYADAANRSDTSRNWERISGRMEYGTGLQFYTKPAASTDGAKAYVLVSVPTMLGTALGTYGDVPVAYAVLRAELDELGEHVIGAEYVYANTVYCQICGYDQESLPGKSYAQMSREDFSSWYPYFYHAAVLKESTRDVKYSSETGHWLSFSVAPSNVDSCFVFAFTIADDEHRERQEMRVGLDTSELIIGIANAFNGETSFAKSMNKALELISQAIKSERLYVFEYGETEMKALFEWRAEGAPSRILQLQHLRNQDFSAWTDLLTQDTTLIVSNVDDLKSYDEELCNRLKRAGVERLLAAPFYHDNELIGFLAAGNYQLEEGFDTQKLLETAAPYLSVKIMNNRLIEELEHLGTHDALTGLYNRRGMGIAVKKRQQERPGEPFAVGLIDVDDFKSMNDTYGHVVGDAALVAIANEITNLFPPAAVCGRNGGDEFAVHLFGDDVLLADALFTNLANRGISCTRKGVRYPISLSVGYACCPHDVENLPNAYTKADVALYAVKLSGKSSAKRYSPVFEEEYRSLLGFSSRDLAEKIPGGIIVHKASGSWDILFANDEVVDMLDCDDPRDFMEYTGGSFKGFVHQDDIKRVADALKKQALEGEGTKGFANYRICTKHGDVKNIAANSRVIESKDAGRVFYVIMVDRDERIQ